VRTGDAQGTTSGVHPGGGDAACALAPGHRKADGATAASDPNALLGRFLAQGWGAVEAVYQFLYSHQRMEWEKELAAADADLGRLVDGYADLPPGRAREKAGAKIGALESRIDRLQGNLTNLCERLESIDRELRQRRRAVAEARAALRSAAPRLKAETLGRVVARVVLYFQHYEHRRAGDRGTGDFPRSGVARIEIIPVVGDAVSYRPEHAAGGGDSGG
jgi:hypothetical protein